MRTVLNKSNDSERVQLFLNKSKITAEEVPILISKDAQDLLFENDDDPYFITQEIDYSQEANGIEYRTEFFNSFLSKLKDSVIAGSRNGHLTWQEEGSKRAPNDLFLVGGKVDAKNKKAYFKNFIPKFGESGDNSEFIKNAKLGLINFSLVTRAKLNIEFNEDTGEDYFYITESISGERNDAVGRLDGAMAQQIIQNQENKMDIDNKKVPLLEQVKNAMKAGTLDISEIIPEKYVNAVSVLDSIKTNTGLSHDEIEKEILELRKNAVEEKIKGTLDAEFGHSVYENGESNLCRVMAGKLIGSPVSEQELKNSIEQLKKDETIISLRQKDLDPNIKTEIKNGKNKDDKSPGESPQVIIEI